MLDIADLPIAPCVLQIEVGNMLNRAAFYYAEVMDLGGHEDITAEEACQRARDNVDEAVRLFTEVSSFYFYRSFSVQLISCIFLARNPGRSHTI